VADPRGAASGPSRASGRSDRPGLSGRSDRSDRSGASDRSGPFSEPGRVDQELDRVETRATVEDLLDALPEREREIVKMRFYDGLAQSAIAHRIGVSQMQVSRLLAQSLTHLRGLAAERTLSPS